MRCSWAPRVASSCRVTPPGPSGRSLVTRRRIPHAPCRVAHSGSTAGGCRSGFGAGRPNQGFQGGAEGVLMGRSTLANFLAMTGDDPRFLAEVIDTFVSDARTQLDTMNQALSAGDVDVLRRAAHTLKSTSQNLGAAALGRVSAEIEVMARSREIDGVAQRLAAADAQLAAATDELLRRRPEGVPSHDRRRWAWVAPRRRRQ
ncbi:MAG: hypothetical protein GEU74_02330 [Nitriliruptorales bacterium]|nr:hypothetical protein [Nitriliruptorales bacterium]